MKIREKKLLLLGAYACLRAEIKIQRDIAPYVNDVYMPSTFVVCLSFLSFYIDYRSAAARAPLGVTSVLTITTMSDGKSTLIRCLKVL